MNECTKNVAIAFQPIKYMFNYYSIFHVCHGLGPVINLAGLLLMQYLCNFAGHCCLILNYSVTAIRAYLVGIFLVINFNANLTAVPCVAVCLVFDLPATTHRKLQTMIMGERLTLLGETMMISMSIFGKIPLTWFPFTKFWNLMNRMKRRI